VSFRKLPAKFSFDSSSLFFNGTERNHCAVEVIEMSRDLAASQKGICFALLVLILLGLASANALAEAEAFVSADSRSSVTRHYKSGGRDGNRDVANSIESIDQYSALETEGARNPSVSERTGAASSTKESGVQEATLAANDFWIYEADVVLFYDDDGDGHFYGIDLLFDADTIYNVADVYAVVYLSYEGGPWNEYSVTEDFTIYGASATDEFVLVTELASGYPTGNYDLLIELFDAFDGTFLASFGPEDTSELAYLPLEDFNRDEPEFDRPVTVSRGGGGASGMWLLLPLALILRRRVRTVPLAGQA